jgi:hypothetical protein
MAGLTTFDAVYIALVLIVPGYVFLSQRNQFVVGQDKLGLEQILSYLTLSGLNFALFGWMIYLAIAYDASVGWRAVIWLALIVFIPFFGGIVSGACSQHDVVRKLYQRIGLKPSHAIPRSWDYAFSRAVGQWVLITLKDGSQCAGFWSSCSFASSDPKERDILIELVYEIPETGPWRATDKSILIAAGEARTIEFCPDTERGDK